jgi:hypothetical protein
MNHDFSEVAAILAVLVAEERKSKNDESVL